MTTETIIALSSTVINGVVMVGVWKLFEEYKSYHKETNWKNVKEFYDDFKIPKAIEIREEEIKQNIKNLKIFEQHREMVRFITFVLRQGEDISPGHANKVVENSLPNCREYFANISSGASQRTHAPQNNP